MIKDYVGFKKGDDIFDFHGQSPSEQDVLLNRTDGLMIIRHTVAHVFAQALTRLFPNVELGIGPATSTGFFHEFRCDKSISSNDFPIIEAEMKKIIAEQQQITKEWMDKKKALHLFQKDQLKIDLINIIADDFESNKLTVYKHGEFITLCEGPHLQNTGDINSEGIKLHSISGVERKGLALQRISGLYFDTKKDLDKYLEELNIQLARDHRKIARKMELFWSFDYAPGNVFWLHRGTILFQRIIDYLRKSYKDFYSNLYMEVVTPPILKQELWKKTGHMAYYSNNMFLCGDIGFKPMSCPCHGLIFNLKPRFKKDLPIRIVEFGRVFRKEEEGGLLGIKRTNHFTQDDSHTFCTIDQLENEIMKVIERAFKIYSDFGFSCKIKLATKPEKAMPSDYWNQAEESLKKALLKLNIKDYETADSEGAFYGPKIEFHLQDNQGKYWQCGTIQVDFLLAHNMDLIYYMDNMDSKSQKNYPVVMHVAILGSIERFIAVLLEKYNGLPFWISPIQVAILSIEGSKTNEKINDYIFNIKSSLKDYTVELDLSTNSLAKKIKVWETQGANVIICCGQEELQNNSVSIRYNNETFKKSSNELLSFLENLRKG